MQIKLHGCIYTSDFALQFLPSILTVLVSENGSDSNLTLMPLNRYSQNAVHNETLHIQFGSEF
jgi:hypothetical protein